MANLIPRTPRLPRAQVGIPTTQALAAYDQALNTALFQIFIDIAQRLNLALPKDGSEPMTQPLVLPEYTVATLPDAASWKGGLVYVSDGAANKRLAISDGANWRFPDGNVVS